MRRLMGIAGAIVLAAGCATSPPARFYTLAGEPAPAAYAAGVAVAVGPVAIPAVVDRPEIVVAVGANEVWLDEFNRWAAPLADGIALAVAADLAAQLSSPRVVVLAQAGADTEYRVALDVQRFETAPGSHALVDAAWTVQRRDGAATGGRTVAREPVPERGYDALAAGHSRALARVAADVAAAVRALAAAPPRTGAGPSSPAK
jgi:uncharacterized lipoprotein YmbA